MRLSPYYETMLGNPERGVESQLRQAAIVSISAAGGRGLPSTNPNPTPKPHPSPTPDPTLHPHPDQAAEGYQLATGRPLQLLFCVMPDRGSATYLYPAVKRWANTSGGVPSQCVQAGSKYSHPNRDPNETLTLT